MDLEHLRRESAQRVVDAATEHADNHLAAAFLIPSGDGKFVVYGTKEQIRALVGMGE